MEYVADVNIYYAESFYVQLVVLHFIVTKFSLSTQFLSNNLLQSQDSTIDQVVRNFVLTITTGISPQDNEDIFKQTQESQGINYERQDTKDIFYNLGFHFLNVLECT